jgi:hypothetical protein
MISASGIVVFAVAVASSRRPSAASASSRYPPGEVEFGHDHRKGFEAIDFFSQGLERCTEGRVRFGEHFREAFCHDGRGRCAGIYINLALATITEM